MSHPLNENSDELADQELSELTAYLDGELSEAEVDAVERRLVTEAPLRRKLTSLDRTWQMLDALEEVSASDQFVRRTLESMAVTNAAEDADPKTTLPGTAGSTLLRQASVWLVTGFVFTVAGLQLGQWISDRNRDPEQLELLENLDVVRRYHLYSSIPDVGFLRELSLPAPPQPVAVNRTVSPQPSETVP